MSFLPRAASAIVLASCALFTAAFNAPTLAQKPATGQSGSAGDSLGLDMSAGQRTRAAARQTQFQKDVTALRADPKLTEAQKQQKYAALYQAMDQDMMAILTPAQRARVQKQRQINSQFQQDVAALRASKALTPAQKQARYVQLVQNAKNASAALLPPAQRAEFLKRSAVAEKMQQAQEAKITEARQLGLQLQKSETSAQAAQLQSIVTTTRTAMQSVIADKTLSDQAKTQKIVALRKDALSRDLALLTPAQRSLYSRIQALITAPAAH